MILHYLKVAVRQLQKNKVQYILSILGVAIGLLCFSLTTYYIRQYFSQYTVWEHADRMASFRTKYPNQEYMNLGISGEKLLMMMENGVPGIEKIALGNRVAYDSNITLINERGEEVPYQFKCLQVNNEFLEVFSVEAIDKKSLTMGPNEVFISESGARRVFGEQNPIGTPLYFTKSDQDTSVIDYFRITAVVKDLPIGVAERGELYFPMLHEVNPDHYYYNNVTALLSEGATVAEVNARLKEQLPVSAKDENGYLIVETFQQQMFEKGNLLAMLFIPLVGSLVLIAALINMLKFSIQSFYTRIRELSIRKTLGSDQQGLFGLLFLEVFLLLSLTTVITFCLTELFLPIMYYYAPLIGIRDMKVVYVEADVLFKQQAEYLVGLFLLCAMIAWIVVARIRYQNITIGISGGGGNRHRFRNLMLGFQLFICFLFIGGGLGMTRIHYNLGKGLNATLTKEECNRILNISLYHPQFKGNEEAIISKIHALSSVEDVLSIRERSSIYQLELSDHSNITFSKEEAGSNYITFMKNPIEGSMPRTHQEVAVSRPLLEVLRKDSVSRGQTITIGQNTYQITGVYDRLPFYPSEYEGMWDTEKYNVLCLLPENTYHNFYIKCVAGQKEKAEKEVMRILREWLPATIPFEAGTLSEVILSKNGGSKMMGDIFLLLSGISLLITILGLYSAIVLDTRSRQKEVAIRKINGAESREIIRLFGRLYIYLVGISAALALPVVYLFLHSAISIPYELEGLNNPFLWLGIFLFVSLLVGITVATRIRNISRINPAAIIKTE